MLTLCMAKLVLFITMIAFLTGGESMKCYQCRADKQQGCSGDELDLQLLMECPLQGTVTSTRCRKIVQELIFRGKKKTTIRECAYALSPGLHYEMKWHGQSYTEVWECEEDGCNSARRSATHKRPLAAALTALLLAILR